MLVGDLIMEDVTNLLGKRKTNASHLQDKRPRIVAFTLNQLEEASKLLYPELVFASCVDENRNCALTCSRRDLYNHPPLGLVSRVRIVLDQNGKYSFQVLLFSKEEGSINTIDEYLQLCSRIGIKGEFKFCPGLDPEFYKNTYYDVIRYDPKSLRRTMYPIHRIDSQKCILWHKLAKNASIFEKDMDAVMCSACKRLLKDLNQRLKKVKNADTQVKENRILASSHYPEKYLSPKSLKKKRVNMQQERSMLLKKHLHMEVCLSEDQHDQMCDIMENVAQIGAKELESSLVEGDKHGVGPAIRAIWKNDLQNIKKEFDEDQEKNCEFALARCCPSLILYSHKLQYSGTPHKEVRPSLY